MTARDVIGRRRISFPASAALLYPVSSGARRVAPSPVPVYDPVTTMTVSHMKRRGMPDLLGRSLGFVLLLSSASGQANHDHPAPEKLGTVSFPVSCTAGAQEEFNRGVALLHSFAYSAARTAFEHVAARDPQCAMAHWGVAMTYFHQLWVPPLSPDTSSIARDEIQRAEQMGSGSDRERGFIRALGLLFKDANRAPYPARALNYEQAMSQVAAENRTDTEAQVFYALALLANASPTDKTHAKQKQAADLLEPLYRKYPEHPGIAALPDPCLRQRGTRSPGPACRASLRPDRAIGAPRPAHALAHLYAAGAVGRIDRFQPGSQTSGTRARRHGRRTARHGLPGVRLPAAGPRPGSRCGDCRN